MPTASPTSRLLAAAIVCCVLDGAMRKWVLYNAPPVLQAVPYFSKDVFILLAAFLGGRAGPYTPVLANFRSMLFVTVGIVALGILLNLNEVRPIGALVSLRTMIVYPLLVVPIAGGLRSSRDIELVVKTVGWMAVLNGVIGAAQFYLPSSHFLNRQIASDLRAHTVDAGELTRIRAMGTFSFISGMGDLAVAGTWAGCLMLLLQPDRRLGHVFIAAGFVCAFAAMSRYGFFLSFVATSGTLWISGRKYRLVLGYTVAAALAIVIMSLYGGNQQTDLLGGIFARHQHADTFGERASAQVQVLLALEEAPLGCGLGCTQAAEKATGANFYSIPMYEAELARVIVEVGAIGLLGIVLTRLVCLLQLWRASTDAGSSRFAAIVSGGGFWTALVYFAHGPAFNHISSTFVWIAIAVALAGTNLSNQIVARRWKEPETAATLLRR